MVANYGQAIYAPKRKDLYKIDELITCIRMGVVCYRVVCLDRLSTHELLTKTITTMWYLLTIILAIIGSFVAWTGEPMGILCVIPLLVAYIANDIMLNAKKK